MTIDLSGFKGSATTPVDGSAPASLTQVAPETNLRNLVSPWINEAIRQHGGGETIRWDISVSIVGGGPAPQVQVGFFFFFPAAELGRVLTAAASVENVLIFDKDQAASMVAGILNHLREQRSQSLVMRG